jgi:beta-lactamase regulating signal transducer with metallopeptidase domain
MEWLSSLGAAWLPVLADAAVKGTVILIVAFVVSLFVRRASAATRHLVWFLALVGLLGLPALSVALPGWQVLPDWFDLGQTAALDASQAAIPPAAVEPAAPPAAESPPWAGGHSAGRPEASPSHPRPLGAASGTPPAPAAEVSRSWSAMNLWIWILPLWAAGAALSLAPVAIGLVSLRRLRRTSRRVADGPWAALLGRLSAELGLKRRVVLLRSARRSMPMAWGLVRPKLLIPEEAEGWSSECLRAVLLHELAHIKRWDCLTQLVARMACGLYWFNPLAWLALHRMVAEHERTRRLP